MKTEKSPRGSTKPTASRLVVSDDKAESLSPLVFISHDSRDAELAEAFGNLLSDASGGILHSFRSSDRKGTAGIEFGAEWYSAIMSKLDQATNVVALLTQNSLNRPWILYESGVAKGKLDKTVLGVVVGIKLEQANAGPFAQFQNCGDDVESLTKLVLQLIVRNANATPREVAVKRQVEAFLDSVTSILAAKERPSAAESRTEDTSVGKLFEEVKIIVRDLPARIDFQLRERAFGRRGKKRHQRFRMMMKELAGHPLLRESGEGPSIGLLLLASTLRDEHPWFYDLTLDFHRAVQLNNEMQILTARRTLIAALDVALNNRQLLDFPSLDDDESFFLLGEMRERLQRHYIPSPPQPHKKAGNDSQADE